MRPVRSRRNGVDCVPAAGAVMTKLKIVKCPFCGENDFDLVGLEMHLYRKECHEVQEQSRYLTEQAEQFAARVVYKALPVVNL